MLKKFIKDNRGQVLYAVLVTVMFVGMISMLTMGLTLRNYNVALQKQQRVADYYAADAAAEMLRLGIAVNQVQDAYEGVIIMEVPGENNQAYTITCGTVTITMKLLEITPSGEDDTVIAPKYEFSRWEVSYHEKLPAE